MKAGYYQLPADSCRARPELSTSSRRSIPSRMSRMPASPRRALRGQSVRREPRPNFDGTAQVGAQRVAPLSGRLAAAVGDRANGWVPVNYRRDIPGDLPARAMTGPAWRLRRAGAFGHSCRRARRLEAHPRRAPGRAGNAIATLQKPRTMA